MKKECIAVVGLGKLGLCLALVLADRGYYVTGIDTDLRKIETISRGKSPIYEPGVVHLLYKNRKWLSVSSNFNPIKDCHTTFVIVPTPSERSGEFSLHFVEKAMREIGKILSNTQGYRLVVLTSTVMPGSMKNVVQPVLEEASGKKCGKDFGLCYNPEFVALGDVVRGMSAPDLILIGESDKRAGNILERVQRRICKNSPKVERMNFVNAELAKISINSFVTMKMSFANSLAEICEKIPGGNADLVTKAIGQDRRIGSSYLKGALGYGGPCFPRDNLAFAAYAERVRAQGKLALATHQVNSWQVRRIIERLEAEGIAPPLKISVLGLTYKPNTDVTDSSQAYLLALLLAKRGFEVHVYDPAINSSSIIGKGSGLISETRLDDCIRKSDVCIIATPWKIFTKINKIEFRNKIVFDCWGLFQEIPEASRLLKIGQYSPEALSIAVKELRRKIQETRIVIES